MANLLTNLLFEPKGTHDPTKAYTIKDTVMSADGSKVYFALKNVPIGIQLNNAEYWICQIDLSATKATMDAATAEAKAAAVNANTAADNAVRTDVSQGLNETQKATARQNIGMDEIIESLSDPLNASGNPLVVKPVGGMPFDSVVTEFSPRQAGSGDPYPAGGGKNLLPNTATTKTVNGVTFTVNADGTITVNGTATADVLFYFAPRMILKAGSYILSGCPVGGGDTAYDLRFGGSGVYRDFGSEKTFTLANDTEITESAAIMVRNGYNANNLVFEPMIRLATETDATYVPYSNIRPISGWNAVEMNHAGKNLLPNTAETQTINGVTFTVNADGSVTANGTVTTNTWFIIGEVNLSAGSYIINGAPVGGNNEKYFLYVDGSGGDRDYGSGGAFTFAETNKAVAIIAFRTGYTANNLTFYPMIRSASDPDATYEPHQHKLHTVQIGETVYGGKLDWTKGRTAAEWGMKAFDGTEVWQTNPYGAYFYTDISGATTQNDTADVMVVSSHFKGVSFGDRAGSFPLVYLHSNAAAVEFRNNGYADVAEWKAFLAAQNAAGTPVQIAYKLATPIEIQLDPTEIIALPGVNTLYGDGSITVTGRQPKVNALETRLAALEAVITNA